MRPSLPKIVRALLIGLALLVPGRAFALQPLSTFIVGGRQMNPDSQVADASVRQREGESDQQLSRLLPAFTARGIYTRNQYEAAATLPGVGTLIITPQDQLDAFFILDVPIADLSQFARYDAQKLQHELAMASRSLTRRQLDERVIRAYYTLTATAALTRSADKSLDASQKNLDVVKERVAAGVAPDLDLQRALANLERSRQDVADAELSRVLALRSLETLSRVTPEPATSFPEDDLHEETPLTNWLRQGKENIPELHVAEAQIRISEANQRVARYGYLPTLAAQAQERFTNATGFTGKVASYTLSATLSYRFDLNTVAQSNITKAAADGIAAQAEGTRRGAEDAIVEAWHRVAANIAKSRAARAQLHATDSAARLTQDRYVIGASTQLDVTQAQRDAFSADVSRIQADLDLVSSRAILRLASGDALSAAASGPPSPSPSSSSPDPTSNPPARANP
jgi:outer membrane protein TolC